MLYTDVPQVWLSLAPVRVFIIFTYLILKKVKVAQTRLPSVGFRSWSRFLALSLQVTWVINPAVGCHYFPPGLQLPSQPLRGLLPISLLGEQRHDGCEQFAENCYPSASRFEPRLYCAWVQHANHSATEPPLDTYLLKVTRTIFRWILEEVLHWTRPVATLRSRLWWCVVDLSSAGHPTRSSSFSVPQATPSTSRAGSTTSLQHEAVARTETRYHWYDSENQGPLLGPMSKNKRIRFRIKGRNVCCPRRTLQLWVFLHFTSSATIQ